MPDSNKPILDYATPVPVRFNSIRAMRISRIVAMASALISVVTMMLELELLSAIPIVVCALSSLLTLIFMTWTGVVYFGVGYALTSLTAALILTPLFGFGIFLIPLDVEHAVANLKKYRPREFDAVK